MCTGDQGGVAATFAAHTAISLMMKDLTAPMHNVTTAHQKIGGLYQLEDLA